MASSGTRQNCRLCNRPVYYEEQLRYDDAVYHKSCFRCNQCKRSLQLSDSALLNGVPYCRQDFVQLQRRNARADESVEDKPSEEVKEEQEPEQEPEPEPEQEYKNNEDS